MCGVGEMANLPAVISRMLILRRYDAFQKLGFSLSEGLVDAVLDNLKLHPGSALHFISSISRRNHHFTPQFKSYIKLINILSNAKMYDEARSYVGRVVEQSELSNLPVSLVFNEIVAVYREFLFSGVVVDMILKAYIEKGLLKHALYVFDKMPSCGCLPSLRSCNALLSRLVRANDFHTVGCVYDQMIGFGVSPDVHTLAIVVDAYCKDGRVEKAVEFVEGLEKMGLDLNVVGYNNLINGFVEKRDMPGVDRILKMMAERSIEKNIITWTLSIKGYCRMGMMDQAEGLFMKMKREQSGPTFVFDEKVYGVLVHGFCQVGRIDDALRIKNEMLSEGFRMNSFVSNALISGYCKLGKIDEAERVMNGMVDENCKPDAYSYSTLLDGYCKKGSIGDAVKIFHRMTSDGLHPSNVTYNVLLKGLCRFRDLDGALELWRLMLDKGFTPDDVGFSTLVHGAFRSKRPDIANTLWKQALARGFAKSTVLLNTMLDGLCKQGKMAEADEILRYAKDLECPPDAITMRTMISGYAKTGDVERALEIMEGEAGSIEVYNSLIGGFFEAGKSDRISDLLIDIAAKGLNPNVVTYGALISGWFKEGKVEKALNAYFEMREKGIDLNVYTCSAMISGLNAVGRNEDANRFLQKLIDLDAIPDLKQFHHLFTVDGDAASAEKISDSLDEGGSWNVNPNHILYNAVIAGLCRCGKTDDARELVGGLSRNGFVPDEFTYSALVHSASVSGNVDEAFRLRDEMVKKGFSPNIVTYNALINGLCKSGEMDRALNLFRKLPRKGLRPSVVTYNTLIDGCRKNGKTSEAVKLVVKAVKVGLSPRGWSLLHL